MMKGRTSAALLACMIVLAGCAGPAQVLFNNSIVVDHLDGNYERLLRRKRQARVHRALKRKTTIIVSGPKAYFPRLLPSCVQAR